MWGTPGFGVQRAEEVTEAQVTKSKPSPWWRKADLGLIKGADLGFQGLVWGSCSSVGFRSSLTPVCSSAFWAKTLLLSHLLCPEVLAPLGITLECHLNFQPVTLQWI